MNALCPFDFFLRFWPREPVEQKVFLGSSVLVTEATLCCTRGRLRFDLGDLLPTHLGMLVLPMLPCLGVAARP